MKASDPNLRALVEGLQRRPEGARPGRTRVPTPRPEPAKVGIDPRIRRRRVDVVRAAGRRRLRLVMAGLAIVVLAAAAWGLTRSPLLDVDRVVVAGATHTDEAAVLSAAAISEGRAMTDVDGDGAARKVSRLPWVERVEVVRKWPSTVRIQVFERRAVAVVAAEGDSGWAVVDRNGRVLAPATEARPDLVVIDSVPPAGAHGTQLAGPARNPLEVAAQLPPGLVPRVATVVQGSDGVELRLNPQGVVLVGDATAIAEKLQAAQTVLAAVDGRTVATLDVRIPGTPVLTRL